MGARGTANRRSERFAPLRSWRGDRGRADGTTDRRAGHRDQRGPRRRTRPSSDSAQPVLEAYGQVGIPPGAVVDGEIRDSLGRRPGALSGSGARAASARSGSLGIAGLRAITRELDMPTLPPERAGRRRPVPGRRGRALPDGATAISSKVIAQYTDAEGAPQLRVLVAAAHLDLIDARGRRRPGGRARARRHRPRHGRAGRVPSTIRVRPGGARGHRVGRRRPDHGGGPPGGVLQFVRTIDLGGESVTRAIASALDLPDRRRRGAQATPGRPRGHDAHARGRVGGGGGGRRTGQGDPQLDPLLLLPARPEPGHPSAGHRRRRPDDGVLAQAAAGDRSSRSSRRRRCR